MSHKKANDFYVDYQNVVRWKSNDRVPFKDMLLDFHVNGLITLQQYNNSNAQRGIDESAFFKRYKEEQENYVPDAEELFEMKSAFGEGATVVNVITGKRITL